LPAGTIIDRAMRSATACAEPQRCCAGHVTGAVGRHPGPGCQAADAGPDSRSAAVDALGSAARPIGQVRSARPDLPDRSPCGVVEVRY
jgi:hypothetical protein